jgi:hypothetical protein
LRGWHGIVIDANPTLIAEYAKVRPVDIALAQVISNDPHAVEFYYSRDSHLISGIGEKVEGPWKRTPENEDVVSCQPARLADLLRRHGAPQRFELLSIETEGNELDVLNSLDMGEFLPTLIAVEIDDFDVASPEASAVYARLAGHGYRVVGLVRPTVFFAL